MKVERQVGSLTLRSAKDLRNLRVLARAILADLQVAPHAQFEFISASSAIARHLLHYPGESEFSLETLVDDSRKGLRATFAEHPYGRGSHAVAGVVRPSRERAPMHGLPNVRRLVDHVDVNGSNAGSIIISFIKWIQ